MGLPDPRFYNHTPQTSPPSYSPPSSSSALSSPRSSNNELPQNATVIDVYTDQSISGRLASSHHAGAVMGGPGSGSGSGSGSGAGSGIGDDEEYVGFASTSSGYDSGAETTGRMIRFGSDEGSFSSVLSSRAGSRAPSPAPSSGFHHHHVHHQ